MADKPYRISPSMACPAFVPLRGWRLLLHRWFRIEFPRARFVFFAGDQQLVCAPETVPAVKRYLERRRLAYVVEPVKLAAVPSEGKK